MVITNLRDLRCTAFSLYLAFQNKKIFQKFLNRADIDVNVESSTGYTVLHHACMHTKNTWALKKLLENLKIVVDIESTDTYTPLLYPAANWIRESVQCFLYGL